MKIYLSPFLLRNSSRLFFYGFQAPSPKQEIEQHEDKISLLVLPDLVLDSIFERLSPSVLCNMASVCSSLRDKCSSDHLWEKHLQLKWGRAIGNAAYREWKWHISSKSKVLNTNEKNGFSQLISMIMDFCWINPTTGRSNCKVKRSRQVDSIMGLYLSLENGNFWFPAQVYNRENGHVGFMLSCYDAQLCYDFKTDSFRARYSPHGRQTIEENIQWDRLRAPPVNTDPYVHHVSDCLHDLNPGDHIEIQWRKNRNFPFGWWYGVVGHLDSCNRNAGYCHCHQNDSIVLVFNQYSPGSRWRQTTVNRNNHEEEGNQVDGFYGGIRKLCKEEEISVWSSLWPTKVLE